MVLEDSVGMRVDQRVVSSDSCRDGLCNATLSLLNTEVNQNYRVSLVVFNDIRNATSEYIGKLILYNIVSALGF